MAREWKPHDFDSLWEGVGHSSSELAGSKRLNDSI
jgi:hypothetical protein